MRGVSREVGARSRGVGMATDREVGFALPHPVAERSGGFHTPRTPLRKEAGGFTPRTPRGILEDRNDRVAGQRREASRARRAAFTPMSRVAEAEPCLDGDAGGGGFGGV